MSLHPRQKAVSLPRQKAVSLPRQERKNEPSQAKSDEPSQALRGEKKTRAFPGKICEPSYAQKSDEPSQALVSLPRQNFPGKKRSLRRQETTQEIGAYQCKKW